MLSRWKRWRACGSHAPERSELARFKNPRFLAGGLRNGFQLSTKSRGTSVALLRMAIPRSSQSVRSHRMMPEPSRTTEDALRRVQGEFLEMPGLRLTPAQARRLWGLDAQVCEALLGALVDAKFLFRTRDGAFMRVETVTPMKA